MKIIVTGGLGNQMFQYALFLALKEKKKIVSLDTSLYSHIKMHNGFELGKCFEIEQPQVKYSKWHLFKLRLLLKFKPKSIIYTDLNYFDAEIFTTHCAYLSGYWQSEKYFRQIGEKVRNTFTFRNIDEINRHVIEQSNNRVSIALHIRRGDYLNHTIYSGVCSEDYYTKAIDLILNKIGPGKNIMFYIFSDDMAFSEQFIKKFNIPYQLVVLNKNENSYKDMYLMSQCNHNIIANSSFSWWGAWLNKNSKKIVIAPEKWFSEDYEGKQRDIIPESWIKI